MMKLPLLALFILLAGTTALTESPPNGHAPIVRIGAALSLSGGVGGSWGVPELQGVELAIDEWNAQRSAAQPELHLVVEDTQSDNPGTVKAVKKLIEVDHVELLVGPTWADSFQGALPLIESAKLPTITPSAGSKTMNPKGALRYAFTMFPSEEKQFSTLLETPARLGITKVAYVLDEDPYWGTFRNLLDRSPPRGITQVAKEAFPMGSADFRSWLTKVKRLAPQAFVGGFASQEASLAFLKQAKALSLSIPFISVDTLCEFRSDQAFRDILSGSVCIYIEDPGDPVFIERFERRYGQKPTAIASRGYDAVMVLARALVTAGSAAGVPAQLERGEQQSVSYGPFRFDAAHGVSAGSFIAKRLVGQELHSIE